MKFSVRQFRGFQDFQFGSFTVYVVESEVMVRGILKKTHASSPYLMIRLER